jgi:hypothetical protein
VVPAPLDRLLVQGDHALAGLGLGPLLHHTTAPPGIADRPGDPHPSRTAHRAIVQGLVEARVVPAQGDQLTPAHPGQGGDQDQCPVAGVDRLDQPVELLAQQPDLATGDRLVAGGGGASGPALAQQGERAR